MAKKTSPGLNLRAWVRDRILFLALAIFLGGGSVYVGVTTLFAPDSIWLHPIKEFSLLIALIGIVSLGYELFLRELTFRDYKEALQEIVNPDAVRLGIKGIYKNRSELGNSITFEELFENVKREIFIGGTSLLSISTSTRELLKEKILSGINVKLLVMDPNSPVVELIAKQGDGRPIFINEIKTSLLLLQRLQYEIESQTGKTNKGQLLVHTYRSIPSHSFVALDQDEPRGMIIADIGPYLGRSNPRPSMVVVKKRDGLYDYWREMNEMMWAESKPFDSGEAGVTPGKTKTLVLVSSRDTEYYDVQTDSWQPASLCQHEPRWRAIKGSYWVWIRESATLEEAKTGTQNKFRIRFDLPLPKGKTGLRAELFVRADDVCHITVNDVGLKQEYGGADYPDPFIIDIDAYLKSGENIIYFELISFAKPEIKSPEENRTGLIYRLQIEYPE